MKVVVRADASLQIGSGHVMRCLTLADLLREHGADVLFICREHPGNLIGLIEGKGYTVLRLSAPDGGYVVQRDDVAHASWLGESWQQDAVESIAALKSIGADWLIVDHYALDRRWEVMVRPYAGKIMVIDDLADRPHDCDLLLDQNLSEDMQHRYKQLVPAGCKLCVGPGYAILRDEFIVARRSLRDRNGSIKRILINFGGNDLSNETQKAMCALQTLQTLHCCIDVVVGANNPHLEKIRELCLSNQLFTYHCQVTNMAELMAHADLAIGGGGTSTWERCFLGLPALVIVLADNQEIATYAAERQGLIFLLGRNTEVTVESLADLLDELVHQPERLSTMSRKCLEFMGMRSTAIHNEIMNCLIEG